MVGWGALVLAILAVAGIQIAYWMISGWSDVGTFSPDEAALVFSEALERAGGGRPYLEVTPERGVIVNRDQEHDRPTPLRALHLVAWEPEGKRLVRISFPFWFVRLKMSDTVNLGTITSVLASDWENLDLKVSVEELERSGPGVVLDHTLEAGSRILLWTEGASGGAGA